MLSSKDIQTRLEGLKKLLEARQTEVRQLQGSMGECGFWLGKAKAEEEAAQAAPKKGKSKK